MTLLILPSVLLKLLLKECANKTFCFVTNQFAYSIFQQMGQCIGKHNNRSRSGGRSRVRRSNRNSQEGNSFRQASGSSVQQSAPIALVGDISTGISDTRQNADNNSNLMPTERASRSITPENMRRREQEKHIGRLVLDTLRKIRTMIDRCGVVKIRNKIVNN